MSVEKAQRRVVLVEAELKKETAGRDRLSQIVKKLDEEIELSQNAFLEASTDKAKTKAKERIRELEAKREEDLWALKKAEKKSSEGEAALNEAREALKQAEEERKARQTQHLHDRENEFFEAATAALPRKLDEIVNGYLAVCEKLAELGVVGLVVNGSGEVRRSAELEKLLASLPERLSAAVRDGNLKRSLLRGHGAPLEVFGFFKADAEGVPQGPVGMLVDPGPIALFRHQRRVAEWAQEFLEAEK